MKPIYKTDFLDLFHCDNMELMASYPDKYFDLAIVDPPYGIDIETSGTYFKQFKTKGWDNATPNDEYFEQLKRVSKNQIIWGGNYFLEHLGNAKCFLIWDKMIGEGMSFADGEMAWTSFKKPTRIKKLLSRSENGKIHPTQKPTDLYDWILKNYAGCPECGGSGEIHSNTIDCDVETCKKCKGEPFKLLDTHFGSGSIALAVDKANRLDKMNLHLTACEIDKDYIDASIKRISQSIKQQTINFE